MAFERAKPGWAAAKHEIVPSIRRLRGPIYKNVVFTARCGLNYGDAPDNLTNQCLLKDNTGLEAKINTLVPHTITEQQAQEWKAKLSTEGQLTIVGACLDKLNQDRPDVHPQDHTRTQCGAVVVIKHPL